MLNVKYVVNVAQFVALLNEAFAWLETSPNTWNGFCNAKLLNMSVIVFEQKIASFLQEENSKQSKP